MNTRILQPILLAAFFWLGTYSSCVFAHALPGSALTFSQDTSGIKLSVSFALEDFVIAAPKFEELQNLSAEQNLSKKQLKLLKAYYDEHLQLKRHSKVLKYILDKAKLQLTYRSDVGEYIALLSEFSVVVDESESLFPMWLKYDGVMHQVRTHKADVYWSESSENEGPLHMASFWYKSQKGHSHGVLLSAPTNIN